MAERMLKPCNKIGCNTLTKDRYCEACAKTERQRQDAQRGNANQRGYDGRWQRYRLVYLQQHPLCVECESRGELTPATVVDHIKPHKGDDVLFWDTGNHQALCKRCHDRKTARNDGGFGR